MIVITYFPCWFEAGLTDLFGKLRPILEGLGFLSGCFCPHYDGETHRRPEFHKMVTSYKRPAFAADDGAALHFKNDQLFKIVSSNSSAKGYSISRKSGRIIEKELHTHYLGTE